MYPAINWFNWLSLSIFCIIHLILMPPKFDMPNSPFTPPNPEGRDIADPVVQRERLFAQDSRILAAVRDLATKILGCRVEPEFPERKPQALIVGGFVRDALLGKKPVDADIEIYGMSADRLEKFLDELFPGKVNKVGKTFGIFSVAVAEGVDLDISLPRRESKVGEGHKGFEVDGDPRMSVEEAARRRDFTFNAMAADILLGEIVDPYGGIQDLKTKILRVTDPERFQDDALRVYRGLQFAGRMGLKVEPQTFALMRQMVDRGELTVLVEPRKAKELQKTEVGRLLLERGDIVPVEKGKQQKGLTGPRISEELKKLMVKAPQPSVGLELARRLGILERYYPEFGASAEATPAWQRLLDTVDGAAHLIRALPWLNDLPDKERDDCRLQIMLGALVANFGREPADIRRLAEGFLARQEFHFDRITKPATNAAVEHLEPVRILTAFDSGELDEKQRDNEIRKLFRRTHPTKPEVLAAVAQAVEQGSEASAKEPFPAADLLLDCAKRHPEWLLAPNQMKLVTGDDLKAMGLKGPAIGQKQKEIEDLRDQGIIETREQALEYLKNRAA